MHTIRFAAILAFGLAITTPAAAQWCAHLPRGGLNCGFSTFEQCQENIRGVGGSCQRDLQAAPGGRERSAAPPRTRSAPAAARENWCAHSTLGSVNCGFPTYQQCMANISGIGGSCQRNTQR
jgi:hypothetical protein